MLNIFILLKLVVWLADGEYIYYIECILLLSYDNYIY
jgi:hypothetical protein